jgi:hypothetical protein
MLYRCQFQENPETPVTSPFWVAGYAVAVAMRKQQQLLCENNSRG